MLIAKQFTVYCIYWAHFQKGFILFSMSSYYKMLYHSVLNIGFAKLLVKFKRVFCCTTQFYVADLLSKFEKYICIKLAPNKVGVSNRRVKQQVYQLELAYVHSLVFRLFVGLMSINPIFLLISVCISKVLVLNSFYYEYSGVSRISHKV